jgi:hypothetical protein
MTTLHKPWLSLGILLLSLNSGAAQSLADRARTQRERRDQEKTPSRVYTNDDLKKYETLRTNAAVVPKAEPPAASSRPATASSLTPAEDEERAWSKRFIEAKNKINETKTRAEALQAKLNELNLKLLRQADVYDRENVYGPLIAQTRQQLEQNKSDGAAAQQALEHLREELRKSGNPISWENSQAALKPDPTDKKAEEPKNKGQHYWQEKLVTIDKRYSALIAPLETERFQLLNRRSPKEGESVSSSGPLGLGAPPRVIDIDVQIKELNQKREKEKQELIQQAIREGALPGWFR